MLRCMVLSQLYKMSLRSASQPQWCCCTGYQMFCRPMITVPSRVHADSWTVLRCISLTIIAYFDTKPTNYYYRCLNILYLSRAYRVFRAVVVHRGSGGRVAESGAPAAARTRYQGCIAGSDSFLTQKTLSKIYTSYGCSICVGQVYVCIVSVIDSMTTKADQTFYRSKQIVNVAFVPQLNVPELTQCL